MDGESRPRVQLDRPVQVGVLVKDMDRVIRMLHELFGIGPFRTRDWPSDRPDMAFTYEGIPGQMRMRLAFAQLGTIELELIQPIGGDSDYQRFLDTHGEGIHHLLFEVPDIDAIASSLEGDGIRIVQTGTGLRPGTRWAHLNSEDLVGFRIELRNRVPGSDGITHISELETPIGDK